MLILTDSVVSVFKLAYVTAPIQNPAPALHSNRKKSQMQANSRKIWLKI